MVHDRDIIDTDRKPLVDLIVARMQERPRKAVTFREYMELCLYHPDYGYYMRDKSKIGKDGDFYTSSSVGTVMGDMLGDQYIAWAGGSPADTRLTLVEWGGGDGRMAKQLLDRLQLRDSSLYQRSELIMIEHSAHHRRLQQEQLTGHPVRWMNEEEWRSGAPWRGVFVWANELLDAFPVHRVRMSSGDLHEIWVAWDADQERFTEQIYPVDGEVREYLARHKIALAEGQTAELNLAAERWISQLGDVVEAGHITLIDYGDEAEEIYAPHRMLGTLMCYRRHQASDDPYRYAGDQDMTSHIDFTACRRAALESGFADVRVVSQAEYLVQGGVLNWLQDHHDPDPFSPAARRNRSIRQLLLSDQMSELFKVMTMRK